PGCVAWCCSGSGGRGYLLLGSSFGDISTLLVVSDLVDQLALAQLRVPAEPEFFRALAQLVDRAILVVFGLAAAFADLRPALFRCSVRDARGLLFRCALVAQLLVEFFVF